MSLLFSHQLAAYRALRATAEVFFRGDWRRLTVAPRFTRLLIGPSGSGKTHVVRNLAREMQLPILEIASVSWIPLGCSERAGIPTWRQIASFCHDHTQGIVFIDEVDKLGERSAWMNHLRVEIFLALDRVLPTNLVWEVDDNCMHLSTQDCRDHAKQILSNNILVVGGGAFQDLWATKNAKTMGFGADGTVTRSVPEQHELATAVPAEIANRFVTPALVLPPLGEREYRLLLHSLCRNLPAQLATRVMQAGLASIEEAISHGLGCRWAERLLLEALTEDSESPTLRQQELAL